MGHPEPRTSSATVNGFAIVFWRADGQRARARRVSFRRTARLCCARLFAGGRVSRRYEHQDSAPPVESFNCSVYRNLYGRTLALEFLIFCARSGARRLADPRAWRADRPRRRARACPADREGRAEFGLLSERNRHGVLRVPIQPCPARRRNDGAALQFTPAEFAHGIRQRLPALRWSPSAGRCEPEWETEFAEENGGCRYMNGRRRYVA